MEPNDLLRQCQKELLFNRTYDVNKTSCAIAVMTEKKNT